MCNNDGTKNSLYVPSSLLLRFSVENVPRGLFPDFHDVPVILCVYLNTGANQRFGYSSKYQLIAGSNSSKARTPSCSRDNSRRM